MKTDKQKKAFDEAKYKMIEKNFRIDENGFVKHIRSNCMGGNGKLELVAFNHLDDVCDWAYNYRQAEIESLKNDLENQTQIKKLMNMLLKQNKTIHTIKRTLEWYASRTIYERVDQFPGDNTYIECQDMAQIVLKQLDKMDK